MDITKRLALSYYRTIATINESHKIYLAIHQETNKIYVKKILDIYNLNVYERLMANHIVGTPAIIELFEENNQLTVIEEYINGTSLEELIANKELSSKNIINYMLDLSNIIEQLHALNPSIIHRDIKPSNIIITSYDHAVLLDFNAAKNYNDEANEDTVLLGTQGYAAPEQYGFGASSPQTDIYSLGIVLSEMNDILDVPDSRLSAIIEKCCKINPDERYANVSDLKEILSQLFDKNIKHTQNTSNSFLPPGYRTKVPWKMAVASAYYVIAFELGITFNTKRSTGMVLWIERIYILYCLFITVLCTFNYRNMQRFIPTYKSNKKAIRILGIIALNIFMVLTMYVVLVYIETYVFDV